MKRTLRLQVSVSRESGTAVRLRIGVPSEAHVITAGLRKASYYCECDD